MSTLTKSLAEVGGGPTPRKASIGALSPAAPYVYGKKDREKLTGDKAKDWTNYLSKYGIVGTQMMPQVLYESGKVKEKKKDIEEIVTEQKRVASEKAEYERTHPMPIKDTEAEKIASRKRMAQRRRTSGRLSTILSESETLG